MTTFDWCARKLHCKINSIQDCLNGRFRQQLARSLVRQWPVRTRQRNNAIPLSAKDFLGGGKNSVFQQGRQQVADNLRVSCRFRPVFRFRGPCDRAGHARCQGIQSINMLRDAYANRWSSIVGHPTITRKFRVPKASMSSRVCVMGPEHLMPAILGCAANSTTVSIARLVPVRAGIS